jgi:hypothetical protein
VSNRRKVDLAKLAAVMTGQMGIPRRSLPAAPARTRAVFPRVPAERVKKLLDAAGHHEAPDGPAAA